MDTFRFANETKICAINECSCSNGDSFKGTKCSKDGAEFCEACNIDNGYFLNVNDLNVQFQTKSYETLYNDGLASLEDKVYGYDWSETFDGENHIEIYSAICSIRKCPCINGIDVVGVECQVHGENECVFNGGWDPTKPNGCDLGYHLDLDLQSSLFKFKCTINECICRNGESREDLCQERGNGDSCETCDPGHSLENAHQSEYIF